jgi:hypothetical protein
VYSKKAYTHTDKLSKNNCGRGTIPGPSSTVKADYFDSKMDNSFGFQGIVESE